MSPFPMESSVISAATGAAGPGVFTPKQALKFFEFFKKGTRRDFILLGDVVPQDVHYIRSKNHKVLCTRKLGTCALCLKAATSDDVSTSHVEHYGPTVTLQKDRDFHQRVAVFTAVMGEQVEALMPGVPHRGHRFSVYRETSQKYKVALDSRSPRVLAHVLPESFDLLPWVRARFGLPQDPTRPLVRIKPFSLRDVKGGIQRPRSLDLAPSDMRTADDWEKTKAKLAEAAARAKEPAAEPHVVEALFPPAPPPPTPQPAPAAPIEPESTPAPAESVKYVLVPSPAKVPDPVEVARCKEQSEAAEAAKRATFEPKDRLSVVSDTLTELSNMFSVPEKPSTNGKHHPKKGGSK